MVWDSRWLVNEIDHCWTCMIVHRHWWSFVVILYLEHANLGDRSETSVAGLDCLNLFEFYHRPSGLLVWCWVDIDDRLSSSGTEPQASQKTLGTLCSLCQSPNHHERLKCYGYQPNWLVWQDPRKTQSLVQDQPKTEDSVPSISLEKCYASWWCGTVGG